ncbi:putative membrane protein [Peteryoungia aggregata LMG 23059]|uniref:Membrane protein n=1 Tax=Peteryoungia aggregata LMG 23059 TaxID=1368425 RepID=A0ABU0G4A5_9HYPH|nr:putative membrane protein [Peteryoungia aggregata LMG 23059]
MVAFIGVILIFGVAIWIVVRCVIGLQKASAGEPIARPTSWWI